MIIKSRTHVNIDVITRELLNKTAKYKAALKNNILDGYRSDTPSLDKVTYSHRTSVNRERERINEEFRRVERLETHLKNAKEGLDMIGDILLTMLEISEDASAVYVGEVVPKFLEHNIHLNRLRNEFYSVVKLYKTTDIPVFVTVNSNTSGAINVDYNIHLDTNNSTRLYYESPKIMDLVTAVGGLAANRPILSIDRLYHNSELVYILPQVPPVNLSTNIYSSNITVLEECITRINNYKLTRDKLATRLEFRRRQLENALIVNAETWTRDLETTQEIEANIANNRFLMKKTEYNI